MVWPYHLVLDARRVGEMEEALGQPLLLVAQDLAEGMMTLSELATAISCASGANLSNEEWQSEIIERGVLFAQDALADALIPILHGNSAITQG